MKKVISLIFILLLAGGIFGQGSMGIVFEDAPFDSLLIKARQENKLIFIDAYTSWCGPCKWMDENTFQNDTVGDFYNEHFINVKVDAEEGEGLEIRKRYTIWGFPSFLFIDSLGNLIHRKCGAHEPQAFIDLGKEVFDSTKQFIVIQNRYNTGVLTEQELFDYIVLRRRSCLQIYNQLAEFDEIVDFSIKNPRIWFILYNYTPGTKYKFFKYMVDNREEFIDAHSSDSVNWIIEDSYESEMHHYVRKSIPDTVKYHKLRNEFQRYSTPNSDRIILKMEISKFEVYKDWSKYQKACTNYLQTHADSTDLLLSLMIAENFVQHVQDSTSLSALAELMYPNLSYADYHYYTYLYASILFKLGLVEDAKLWGQRALKMALENDEEDVYEIKQLLRKIELDQSQ